MTSEGSGSSRLEHFPISFFAVVMGISGLSIATGSIERHFAWDGGASLAIAVVAGVVFASAAVIYAIKVVRHRAAVVAEWRNPIRLNFFPTISVSLLLLSTAALPIAPRVALWVWGAGAALHLYATLTIVAAWIGHRRFETLQLNPAWFIPAVGNIVIPLAGVPLGFVELSWFFYAIGFLFWLVLMTLVFNRLVFHNPLPERLLPTLMILVAPPAVAFLAYLRLGGPFDAFARVMFYAAVGLFLMVATQFRQLARLPFALSWWACSFPLAALTTATAVYADLAGSSVLAAAFVGLYVLLVGVVVVLLANTVLAIGRGEICRPEA